MQNMKRQMVVICPVLQKTLQVSDHIGKMSVKESSRPLFEFSEICLGRGFKYFFLLACLGFVFCLIFFCCMTKISATRSAFSWCWWYHC